MCVLYRVIEEVDEVMGDKEMVEADDIDKLIYMHQVYTLLVHVETHCMMLPFVGCDSCRCLKKPCDCFHLAVCRSKCQLGG